MTKLNYAAFLNTNEYVCVSVYEHERVYTLDTGCI